MQKHDNINIYYLEGNKIQSVSEYLPCDCKEVFASWKKQNGIGDDVQLIDVKIDDNRTESIDSSVAVYTLGDYFVFNIIVSADLKNYFDTIPEKELLESLKLTLTGFQDIEFDEYNHTSNSDCLSESE